LTGSKVTRAGTRTLLQWITYGKQDQTRVSQNERLISHIAVHFFRIWGRLLMWR